MSNTPITINDIHEICNTAWAQTTKVVDFLDPNTLDTIDFTKFSDDGTNTDDKNEIFCCILDGGLFLCVCMCLQCFLKYLNI